MSAQPDDNREIVVPNREIVVPDALEARPSDLVRANTIYDFRGTEFEKDFVFRGTVTDWAKQGAEKRSPEDLTPAEKCIQSMAGQFTFSAEADEYYATIRETEPKLGDDFYASVHVMLMNGRQDPHYHPDFSGDYPHNSLRVLTVIPFANSETRDNEGNEHTQGIKFKFFELEDPSIKLKPTRIGGTPKTPQHVVHFPPGKVCTLVFAEGVHQFEGNGIIVSFHPLDAIAKNIGNTYDANSIKWPGEQNLQHQEQVKIEDPKNKGVRRYDSLPQFFGDIKEEVILAATRITAMHNPHAPITKQQIGQLRRNMRERLQVIDQIGPSVNGTN